MPKATKNALWLEGLQELRNAETPDSNKYLVYNKAYNSLKRETKEYANPDSLLAVKFIGPSTVGHLKKWMKDGGGVPTMGEIPSNLPSPAKRKRGSGAASSSEPKKRGRPSKQPLFEPDSEDDDGGDMHPSKRHSGFIVSKNSQPLAPAFPPPDFPLGIAPQLHQQHVNPDLQMPHHFPSSQSALHNQHYYDHPPAPAYSYQQPVDADPVPSHLPPPAQSAQLLPSFNFYYMDPYRKRVLSRDMAVVDIHDSALWYKLCFLDVGGSKAHPVIQRLRLVSYDFHKGTRRENVIEAWVKDQDVEEYSLNNSSGFTDDDVAMNHGLDVVHSGTTSQTASSSRSQRAGGHLAGGRSGEITDGKRSESLEDLLKAENKKRRNTIDPSRNVDMDKEWDVSRGGIASGVGKLIAKTEETRARKESSTDDLMRQRSAMAAMVRQQASFAAAGGPTASSSRHEPSTSSAKPALRKANTLPGTSVGSHFTRDIPQASTGSFDFEPAYPAPSAPSSQAPPIAHKAVLRRAATDVPIPTIEATSKPKPKAKGKVRGRVSEFAPAPAAVDEFDADLDRQAAHQRLRAEQRESAPSASHASADLIDNVMDLTVEDAPSFPAFNHIVFPPNSYEIILVLDNREVKSHKHRDHIVSELWKKGVRVEQRSLSLGDVLWIARRRSLAAGVEVNECVLNYILERKRLDDLCGSIKEGRFHEQKFRLANTGLKVFYLIEDYDVEKNREVFGVQIDTARSSTQIVDGFIVKETKKLSYTIDYLATMHQTIIDMYQNKPLYVIPPSIIKRHSYMAFQKHLRQSQPTVEYLTSYGCFDKLNSKSANLTTRDILAQMLLSVKGLSAEKVAVIIETYPTLRSLWDAFRVAEAIEREGKQREMDEANAVSSQAKGKGRKRKSMVPEAKAMLCNIGASGRKYIGPTLSENIYRLMKANTYQE